MRDVRIGVTLPQFTSDREVFVDGVERTRKCGFDSLWVFDHLWPLSGGKERPVLEAWTTVAWLAAATEGCGIGTLVTRSTLRHPAVLAKMAATVGAIAPARLTVGVGSGDAASRDENESFGIRYFDEDDRVPQLRSTVQLLRNFLDGGPVTQHDEFVDVENLPASPTPPERVPLWVGGRSDDTLEVAGLLADGWNGWGGNVERFTQDAQNVLRFAGDRPFELSWGGIVDVGGSPTGDRITGTAREVADRLLRIVDAGARHLVITLPHPGRAGAYEDLAADVVRHLG
jgi:alkanesulfonate monooxygenase SsuD/methylene tetrahydromethanopterin reductase-like flavin-dependent oxidoreductase (luciferase family)